MYPYTVYVTHKLHFSATFSLKMGLTALFTHFKIILLQYFQFSIFNFSKISGSQINFKVRFGSTFCAFTFCVFLFFLFVCLFFLAIVVNFSSIYNAHFSNINGSRALFTRPTNCTFQQLFH